MNLLTLPWLEWSVFGTACLTLVWNPVAASRWCLGFVAAELLADGAIEASPAVGVAMVLAAAVNGIAVVRAYFFLFTGGRRRSSVSLGITPGSGWRSSPWRS